MNECQCGHPWSLKKGWPHYYALNCKMNMMEADEIKLQEIYEQKYMKENYELNCAITQQK